MADYTYEEFSDDRVATDLEVKDKTIRVIEHENDDGEIEYHLPYLYTKNSRGKMNMWKAWVCGDTYYRSSGQVGGKMRDPSAKTVKGKNIGRANETTPEDQALLECFSYWEKQLDKGYTENPEGETVRLFPMLARDYTKDGSCINFPCAVQPKLDGARMLATYENGEVVFWSRGNKQFKFLDHIRDELRPIFEKMASPVIFDGELYTHGMDFREIISAIRQANNPHPEETKIEYHVYDLYDQRMNFEQRMGVVEDELEGCDKVKIVWCNEADNEDEVKEYLSDYIEDGYEGAIIRNWEGEYLLGKSNRRSPDLQKYKLFDDAEFKVVGAKEGDGTEKGAVVWQCVTKDGSIFETRPRGSHEERRELYQNRDSYIGKMLTVRYQGVGVDDIPRFPIGIAFRDYE